MEDVTMFTAPVGDEYIMFMWALIITFPLIGWPILMVYMLTDMEGCKKHASALVQIEDDDDGETNTKTVICNDPDHNRQTIVQIIKKPLDVALEEEARAKAEEAKMAQQPITSQL
jgi:hypothetical protein